MNAQFLSEPSSQSRPATGSREGADEFRCSFDLESIPSELLEALQSRDARSNAAAAYLARGDRAAATPQS